MSTLMTKCQHQGASADQVPRHNLEIALRWWPICRIDRWSASLSRSPSNRLSARPRSHLRAATPTDLSALLTVSQVWGSVEGSCLTLRPGVTFCYCWAKRSTVGRTRQTEVPRKELLMRGVHRTVLYFVG